MNQNSSYSSPQGGITPAMLATFQHQKSNIFGAQSNAGGNINPAQLLNGSAAINPTQLLQQQHNMINGMGIPSGGGGSINPAALTAASPPSSSHNSPFSQQQQQQHVPNFNSMLQVVGITREQFQSLSPQDKQTVGAKYMSAFNAHQQQQQMAMMNAGLMNNNTSNNAFSNQGQNQNFYDRPSSSASSHSQPQQPSSSNQMLPPPPPRPPTAQDGQSQSQGPHPSRPGTSLAHRSPTIPGGHQGQMLEMMHMKEMMQHQGQQRSQSRMAHRGDPMMNGFNSPMGVKPSSQQQQGLFTGHQHQLSQHSQQSQSQSSGSNANAVHQQNQYSNQPPQTTSSPPAMDSPYRGTPTRKIGADMGSTPGPGGIKMPMSMGVPGSPRIGGGLGLGGGQGNVAGAGIMGPPGLPRSVSGDAMNMMGTNNANANVGNMINGQQRQSPRPPSSIGMNADMSSRLGPSGPSGPQQQQQQRQGSIPPQFSIPLQQQQMRQGSLPPGTGPGQQQRQKMGQDGMNIGGGMGGGMGMGMKTNNEMRASMTPTSTTPMNMPMNMGMGGVE